MNCTKQFSSADGPSRRAFLKRSAGLAVGLGAPNLLRAGPPDLSAVPLGLVNHSLRGMGWKAARLLEYAAGLQLDSLVLNTLSNFESLETAHLESLKMSADAHGIRFYIGAGSISKGSIQFRDTHGTPKQVVETGIRVATAVGSPVVLVRIGNVQDRFSEGGIEARIEEVVTVLRSARSQAQDAGLMFGFENHSGDLRSEELLGLIEAVGTDVCGVMLDPGNAIVALEDPMEQVRMLAKYTVCTSVRDYMIWPSEEGAQFQWTALGDGLMDVRMYAEILARDAPGVPINVETISNTIRSIPFLTDEYMKGFPDLRAGDLTDFLRLVRRGYPIPVREAPPGTDAKAFERNHQRYEFERSIAYLRDVCRVGRPVSFSAEKKSNGKQNET